MHRKSGSRREGDECPNNRLRSLSTTRPLFAYELSEEAAAAIETARMDSRHARLDRLLDE
jgi:hypothetical protein